MRVILTQNVPKLGVVGDVCTVAPGYGRNYLIPQGMAILAARGALRQVDDMRRTEQRRQDKIRGGMRSLADKIAAAPLTFTAKVGQTGRLYGSITSADIAERLSQEIGEEIDRRKILLDESIRSLGDHDVEIHLMPGVDASVRVTVVADSEVVPDAGFDEDADQAEEAGAGQPTHAGEDLPAGEAEEAEAEAPA